jgi:hypothetical protein
MGSDQSNYLIINQSGINPKIEFPHVRNVRSEPKIQAIFTIINCNINWLPWSDPSFRLAQFRLELHPARLQSCG